MQFSIWPSSMERFQHPGSQDDIAGKSSLNNKDFAGHKTAHNLRI
jgi:hypothetical protein